MAWDRLPTLTHETRHRWFRDMEIALKGKGVFWVTQRTKQSYIDSTVNVYYGIRPIQYGKETSTERDYQRHMISWYHKKDQYVDAEARAFGYLWLGDSLSHGDKDMYDDPRYQTFKSFWEMLKNKYQRKASTTTGESVDGEAVPPHTDSPAS